MLSATALLAGFVAAPAPAWALSEIQREDLPPAGDEQRPLPPGATEPAAPDATAPQDGQPASPESGTESDDEDPARSSVARPDVDPNAPLPEILYDVEKLPEPVQRMRKLLIEAAKTGDIEKLRPLLGTGENATQLSLADINDDPIAFLKSQSGDPEGEEILAIMEEVLSAGYVHLDAGTPEELYVWPYFFAYPLDKLTPPQKVEIYKIVTASDFEEMQNFGNYIFYRLGISPDGNFAFFVAGE
ncbi:MAG: alanine and proline-rich secreted protein Apa [Rhizobiaceae bacterium]|nr:alanine and proline-rich secreted protein Apa [Rhizobiaceae bacterium]